jgi:hypothetical protein
MSARIFSFELYRLRARMRAGTYAIPERVARDAWPDRSDLLNAMLEDTARGGYPRAPMLQDERDRARIARTR